MSKLRKNVISEYNGIKCCPIYWQLLYGYFFKYKTHSCWKGVYLRIDIEISIAHCTKIMALRQNTPSEWENNPLLHYISDPNIILSLHDIYLKTLVTNYVAVLICNIIKHTLTTLVVNTTDIWKKPIYKLTTFYTITFSSLITFWCKHFQN